MQYGILFRSNSLAIVNTPTYGIVIRIRSKLFFDVLGLPTFRRALSSVRRVFPYFFAVGLRDCDTGGRVCAWYYDWALNYWRIAALEKRWDGCGDGEVYCELSLHEFLQQRRDARQRESIDF